MGGKRDEFVERMKRYDRVANSQKLIPGLPLYARVDGRRFTTFAKDMGYPYVELKDKCGFELSNAMMVASERLCREFCCDLVETHSDEISLGWTEMEKAPFDGEYFKLVSNIASYASVVFFNSISRYIPDKISKGFFPSFDCRVFQLPDTIELANVFIWRQNDCILGCLNQYAQQFFSHKQLEGKSCDERRRMLEMAGRKFDEKVGEVFRYGYFCERQKYEAKIPPEHRESPLKDTVSRTRIGHKEVGFSLSKLLNKVGFLFGGEKPMFKPTRLEHGHRTGKEA